MKICLIGKYPPIEGGVSMHNYWTAHGLAERGHKVYVVTNANEVEDAYRIHLDADDKDWYQPKFETVGGFVKVFHTEPFSMMRMRYIPTTNPFVSKLASLATQVIRQYGCEAIYAYYYEPYGVAGYLASQWTELPLMIKHAGSDLERLMKIPDLAGTYKEILKSADCVLTARKNLAERFIGMGVKADKIYPGAAFFLPTTLFKPGVEPLNIEDILKKTASTIDPGRYPDTSKPTIGIYGKLGWFKGSFDLVNALGILKREGLDFNFLAMSQGLEIEKFKTAISNNGIDDCTWLIPFLPHWKVPQFISACTAVCFLERDFPIAIHGPTIPREVLSCGTCLILSDEIAKKQSYRHELVNEENILIVRDPKNHQELADCLRFVIQNPQQACAIGVKGHLVSQKFEDFSCFITEFESLLNRLIGQPSTAKSFEQIWNCEQENEERSLLFKTLNSMMPWLRFFPEQQLDDLILTFQKQANNRESDRFEIALNFCNFLENKFQEQKFQSQIPCFKSILQYQKAQLLTRFDQSSEYLASFSAANAIANQAFSENLIFNLKPLKGNYSQIEIFTHDVTPIFNGDFQLNPALSDLQLPEIPEKTTFVCFHKLPNLAVCEKKINAVTKNLLELCNGVLTTESIVRKIAEIYDIKTENQRNKLTTQIILTLKQLYDSGIIIFC
jgi:glycosyltransferase involved in cell wall biosynthesis